MNLLEDIVINFQEIMKEYKLCINFLMHYW